MPPSTILEINYVFNYTFAQPEYPAIAILLTGFTPIYVYLGRSFIPSCMTNRQTVAVKMEEEEKAFFQCQHERRPDQVVQPKGKSAMKTAFSFSPNFLNSNSQSSQLLVLVSILCKIIHACRYYSKFHRLKKMICHNTYYYYYYHYVV